MDNARLPMNSYKRQVDKANLKAQLVRLYKGNAFAAGNTLAAKKAFVLEYNRPGGKYSKFYAVIGPASFQTFERWNLKLKRCHGRPSCLIDSRGMHRARNRKAARRTVSRLLGLITKVPAPSRDKWFQFLDAMKAGHDPEEISRSVGLHTSTIRKWIRNLEA